jgi:hypothetical protein
MDRIKAVSRFIFSQLFELATPTDLSLTMNAEPASIQEASDLSTFQRKVRINSELAFKRTFLPENPEPCRRNPIEKQSVDRISPTLLCDRFDRDQEIHEVACDAKRDVRLIGLNGGRKIETQANCASAESGPAQLESELETATSGDSVHGRDLEFEWPVLAQAEE